MKLFHVELVLADSELATDDPPRTFRLGTYLNEQQAEAHLEALGSTKSAVSYAPLGVEGVRIQVEEGRLNYIEAQVMYGRPPFPDMRTAYYNSAEKTVVMSFVNEAKAKEFFHALQEYLTARVRP